MSLQLPEYVNISLKPNDEDGGKTFMLTIEGRVDPTSDPVRLKKAIPRNIGAIQFGRDLLNAMAHIYGRLHNRG